MPIKQKPKTREQDDPKQSKRFLEAAREVEADETEEGADRAFRKAVNQPRRQKKPR